MDKENNKSVQLSERLLMIASMVTPGMRVADIGTDHGFVPIYLILNDISPEVYAMDVRKGPLDRAKEHVAEYGLADKIHTRLSDGLEKLAPGEADTVTCAGMGGPLMQKILENGNPREKGIKEMILQPQSELMEFRQYLRDNKYNLLDEKTLCEDGKYYFLMKVDCTNTENMPIYINMTDMIKEKCNCSSSQAYRISDRFGPFLLRDKSETLKAYILHGISVAGSILDNLPKDMTGGRRQEVEEELEDLKMALSLWN